MILGGSQVGAASISGIFSQISGDQASDQKNAPDSYIVDQFWWSAEKVDLGKVKFTFANQGPLTSAIGIIYFDGAPGDYLTSAVPDFVSTGVVSFARGANPSNLAGGNSISPPFIADDAYQAIKATGQNASSTDNRINPGESLGIIFTLLDGVTFKQIIEKLVDESLRFGIHVQSFGPGGNFSAQFVSGFPADPGGRPVE